MTIRTSAICATVILWSGAVAFGVAADRQTRDAGVRAAVTGSAVIAGTLVTDDSDSRPVRRATVTLAGTGSSRVAVTDDAGRFAFTRLPAGNFSMTARKTGYVPVFYGSKRPGRGPGVAIAVAEGQRQSVQLRMLRGAVLTGTVSDQFGRPAVGLAVQATRVQGLVDVTPSPGSSTTATTDDRGVYRIFGLAPASYVISVAPPSAGFGELRVVTADEVQKARQQLSAADPRTGAGTQSPLPLPPPGPPVGYAPVYYPGTVDAAAAQRVPLGPGEERGGVSFAMQYVPTARIEGMLVDATGQLIPDATVLLVPKSALNSANAAMMIQIGVLNVSRPTMSGGKFSVGGVTPGEYIVQARSGPAPGAARPGNSAPGAPPRWGQANLTVDGQDQSGVAVTLHLGATVSGTVAFAGTSLAPPENPGLLRLLLAPVTTAIASSAPIASVQASGAFTASDVMPGAYNVRVPGPSPVVMGWTLKSVTLSGRDVADLPLELAPGASVAGLVATFTDQPTEISGTLFDGAGRPTSELSIVVFSTDRRFWLQTSRRTQATRPATNGTFKIANLPAGEYFMTAVTDYEPADLYDPSFLEQLQATAFKLTLADGERKKQDLKLAGR